MVGEIFDRATTRRIGTSVQIVPERRQISHPCESVSVRFFVRISGNTDQLRLVMNPRAVLATATDSLDSHPIYTASESSLYSRAARSAIVLDNPRNRV
jgi:hypothetical protein